MTRDTFIRQIDPNSQEFTRLLREARARRVKSVPIENRWYPEDREGTDYTTAGGDTPKSGD